jgi:hypothetical protein
MKFVFEVPVYKLNLIDLMVSGKFGVVLKSGVSRFNLLQKGDLYFSTTRRAFIEAKYVQKSFLRPLPSASQMRSSTRTIKRWSVMRSSLSTDTDDETSKTANRQLLSKFVF